MQNVEILKGSSQIYGPFTTGGAINFDLQRSLTNFNLRGSYGSYDTGNFYTKDSKKNFGYMIEYNNIQSDGFKNLDVD